jgi:nucleolar protein 15
MHKALEKKLEAVKNSAEEWNSSDDEGEEAVNDNDESDDEGSQDEDLEFINKDGGEDDEAQGVAGTKQDGVVYIGHLPPQMEEQELAQFLNQFGPVAKVKVSRSAKSGRSRGYAFVKFVEGDEVAKVVAETLSGFFVMKGERRLVCHIVEPHKVHPDLFKGAGKTARHRTPVWTRQEQRNEKYNRHFDKAVNFKFDGTKGSNSLLQQKTQRLADKEESRRAKLRALGMEDYADSFPGFQASQAKAVELSKQDTLSAVSNDDTPKDKPKQKKRKA